MGEVQILDTTTKLPITLMGERAGICWHASIQNQAENYKRGLGCLKHGHFRLLEYVNVEMVLSGWSARVIREWYTHIGGAPTRLQESTRRVDYDNFEYVIPPSVQTNEQITIYYNAMDEIKKAVSGLENLGVPREDAANLLPLGMTTTIVDKRNARNLMDMSRQRMCSKAYYEYRNLFNCIIKELQKISEEWQTLISMVMHPKCEEIGYCPEAVSCGRYSTK